MRFLTIWFSVSFISAFGAICVHAFVEATDFSVPDHTFFFYGKIVGATISVIEPEDEFQLIPELPCIDAKLRDAKSSKCT